ncbi:MAG: DEAD/DEAH box helicase [Gammaproteobacteria bacterium]|nr:DEAD/DEAH box helicase [Gammaproteobacteria bacterium]
MSFNSFGLAEEIVRAVKERGYTEPTPVQTQAIPAVMSGTDLLAGAQTGTGKTAGFVLPILHQLGCNSVKPSKSGPRPVRALILTPTRELAAQVEESVRDYGRYLRIRSMVMFGGVNIRPQIRQLNKGVDILVATPGRLLDHVQQGTLDLSGIEILVLDEADRMLDMGFIHDIRRILKLLPQQRQNLLFSATFSNEIKALADRLLNSPKMIEVAKRNATADNIDQRVYPVDKKRKIDLLVHLIKEHNWYQVLVFSRTKHGANKMADKLNKAGIESLAIHGNKSQPARTRALSQFKKGTLQVLVATDIAARGIDINELPHVVNFDLPHVPEDYVHRIGRTGRAGSEGEASSLVCVDEHKLLANIEKLIRRRLPKTVIEGFEPDPNIKAEPIQNGRGGGQNRGQNRNQNPNAKNHRGTRGRKKQVGGNTRSEGSGKGRSSSKASHGRYGKVA